VQYKTLTKLRDLELAVGHSDRPCPNPVTTMIVSRDQPDPPPGPPCRFCGRQHVVEVVEEVITSTTVSPLAGCHNSD
jgi:hypothetical protein